MCQRVVAKVGRHVPHSEPRRARRATAGRRVARRMAEAARREERPQACGDGLGGRGVRLCEPKDKRQLERHRKGVKGLQRRAGTLVELAHEAGSHRDERRLAARPIADGGLRSGEAAERCREICLQHQRRTEVAHGSANAARSLVCESGVVMRQCLCLSARGGRLEYGVTSSRFRGLVLGRRY